jgi:hypothetical protein
MKLKLSVISGAVSVYAKPTSIGPPKFATPKTVIAGPAPVARKVLFDWLRVANWNRNSFTARLERFEINCAAPTCERSTKLYVRDTRFCPPGALL